MGHAPSYGLQLSYILASPRAFPFYPDPEETNRILASQTSGGFRYIDGDSLIGMMQPPKHIRDAIAQETEIDTLAAPPQDIGQGTGQG